MKIFITGADGFVGSNLLRELLNRELNIVAFVESGQKPVNIESLKVEIKYGNILYFEGLAESMKGCDTVIHTAAKTDLWPYRSEIQKRINIDGTINMIKAAKINNVKRFIHIGTANSFGYGTKENPGNETRPYLAHRYKLDYLDTKYKTQNILLQEIKESGFPALILNPTFMFGSYAGNFGSATFIKNIYKNKIPGFPGGGRNYIAVKDVCVGIANALTMGKIGECYILGNKNLSYKELFTLIAEVTGGNVPRLSLPPSLAKLAGLIMTAIGLVFKIKPNISYRMAAMSCDEHYYSSVKAVNELKLPQTPLKEALKEAFEWLKQNQFL